MRMINDRTGRDAMRRGGGGGTRGCVSGRVATDWMGIEGEGVGGGRVKMELALNRREGKSGCGYSIEFLNNSDFFICYF